MRVAVLLSSAVLLVATAAATATAGDAVREPVDGLAADADADAALVLQRARAVLYGLLEERASSLSSSSPARALATSNNDNNAAGLWMIAETDEVWRDAAGPVGCAACEAILAQLKIVAAAGDAFFIRFLTELCKRTRIQDDDVCAGSIALEGPIVARGIRDVGIGSKASRLFCVHALGLCEYPDVEEWKVPFPSESPPPTPSPPPPSSSPSLKSQDVEKKPLYIVHYSDVHVDPFYEQGANANCTKPICCRNYPDSVIDDNFLPAGPHGDHKCDPPISLEESMYAAIRELVPDASFSIFTGDIVDHAVWNTTQAQNTVDIDASYIRMADIVGIPVYGAAGNHESSPTNSFPPEGTDDSAQWLYDVLSLTWVRWVGPDAVDTVRRLGAYSTKLADMNLRIISLNTNLHYAQNYWLYEDPMQRDPSGQLAWLVGELDAAEQSGERVYIIGHMPMGSVDAFHDGSNYFDQIARRYSPGTIAGLFFGHTHLDEFQVAYRDYGSRSHEGAFATTYIAPSLTPMSGHPSFRVYTVDPETFGVLDMTSYRADMSLPDFQGSPQWEKYYSAREAYGPLVSPPLGDGDELTPAFWHDVTEVLERNATAFGEYLGRKRRGWLADEVVAACDESCARLEICKLRGARAQDNCMRPAPQVKSAGTSEPSLLPAEDDECEGSVLRGVLGSVGVQRELLSLGALDGSGADMERRPGDDEMSEL